MNYLTLKQIEEIDTISPASIIADIEYDIEQICSDLEEGDGTDTQLIKNAIEELRALKRDISEIVDSRIEEEDTMLNSIQHTAICNEIYDNLENNKPCIKCF